MKVRCCKTAALVLLGIGGLGWGACGKPASQPAQTPPAQPLPAPTPEPSATATPSVAPVTDLAIPKPSTAPPIVAVSRPFLPPRVRPIPRAVGELALQHARAICLLGSRGYHGAGRISARAYLKEKLGLAGWQVVSQAFQAQTPEGPRDYINLIARFPNPDGKVPTASSLSVFAAHYDAPESKVVALDAASAGAAGCGVLLELATLLSSRTDLSPQVELVFWDGEMPARQPTAQDGLYGSRFYLHILRENNQLAILRNVLVFGAMGHRNAVWTQPLMSTPALNARLQSIAQHNGWAGQTEPLGRPIWAGHLSFFAAGVAASVLTDGNYPLLDTADDSAEQLDALSLKKATQAALDLLAPEKKAASN